MAYADVLCLSLLTAAIGQTLGSPGEMRAGEAYCKALASGLWFCLHPNADLTGWNVAVSTSCRPQSENFAAVATPPFHTP